MPYKYNIFCNNTNDDGTLMIVRSNELCKKNVQLLPAIKKVTLDKALKKIKDYQIITFIEEYAFLYLHTEKDDLQLFVHHTLNLDTVDNEFIKQYKKELKGAQAVAKKNYKGPKFESIHFSYVDYTEKENIN